MSEISMNEWTSSRGCSVRPWRGRYEEARRTYLRPWPVAWSVLALMVGLLGVSAAEGLIRRALAGGECMLVGVIGMFVVLQLRRQMDHPRSALMPGFRLPHFVAAAVALTVLNLVVPIPLAVMTWTPYPDLVAYSVTCTAVVAWLSYEPLGVCIVLPVVVNCLPHDNVLVVKGLLPEEVSAIPHLAAVVMFVSMAAILALFGIFARFNGEGGVGDGARPVNLRYMPRAVDTVALFRVGMLTATAFRGLLWLGGWVDRWRAGAVPTVVQTGRLSFWRRVQLRRRVTFSGVSPALAGAVCPLSVIVVSFLTGSAESSNVEEAGAVYFMTSAVLLVGLMGIQWPQRWVYLAGESLVPARRREFVRETAAGLALDVFWYWVASSVVASIGLVLAAPRPIATVGVKECIVACILMNGALFLFGGALVAWAMLFRNAVVSVAASVVAIAMMIGLESAVSHMENLIPALALAGVAVPIGAYAYWRWGRVELG